MLRAVHIICNPMSGNGHGKKRLAECLEVLNSYRIRYHLYKTDYQGHERHLVEELLDKQVLNDQTRLLVIGGDGTLHEVVESLYNADFIYPVSYISAGTGNDFARSYLRKRSVRQIIDHMVYIRRVQDIPVILYRDLARQEAGIAVNSLGFGFDGQIIKKKQELGSFSYRFKRVTYLLSLLASLPYIPSYEARVWLDGQLVDLGPVHLSTIMNNPSIGGGIYLDPYRHLADNYLSLIILRNIKAINIPKIAWQILVSKQPLESPHYERLTGHEITIEVPLAVLGQVDGEKLIRHSSSYQLRQISYPFIL